MRDQELSKRSQWRILLAFVIAPITPALPILLITTLSEINSSAATSTLGLIRMYGFAAALAYPPAILLGVPAYLYLSRHSKFNNVLVYLLLGTLFGVVEANIIPLFFEGKNDLSFNLAMSKILGFCGFIASLVFIGIAKPFQETSNAQTH